MNSRSNQRIVVGMSGGVDSSVAAMLLKKQGYDVHGLYMVNWEEDEQGYCTAAEDFQDAVRVCEQLKLPLHKVNFAAEYRKQVFDVFLEGLQSGLTPNPDVLCNREIKFGTFLEYAKRLGAQAVATGHYARSIETDGEQRLLRGVDSQKDQSYFLHAVPQAALAQALFPLGDLHKPQVRKMASDAGLLTARKRDSTGICFIGERPFRQFLQEHMACANGEMRTPDDQLVGEHVGLPFYTLGQRQGLGIGGVRGSNSEPWYVAQKDHQRNVLIVVQGRDDPLLYSDALTTGPMHWINTAPAISRPVILGEARGSMRCQVSTRYRQSPADAQLTRLEGGGVAIEFNQPQWAVTPGQYAVVYDGEHCLGGGAILSTTGARSLKRTV